MSVRLAADEPGYTPWPEADAAPLRPGPGGRVRVGVAVVGAGFTGLSTAYHLLRADPGLDVVVLDAARAGAGASGRCTGILRPGVGGSLTELTGRVGPDAAGRLYQVSRAAVRHVRDLVARERIDCALEEVPHVKLARTARQAAHLHAEARALTDLGLAARFDAEPGVPGRHRGGLCLPGSAQLDPTLLVRGLRRAGVAAGARLHERTPVTAVRPGRTVELEVAGGVVVADRVVLATNGYTPGLGWLAGQVIPLQTHLGVTEPLDPDRLPALGWTSRRSFSDSRHVFDYVRLTRDDRVVFGGGRPLYAVDPRRPSAGATDVADPTVWRRQRRDLTATVPGLAGVGVTRQWAGTVGMTLDRLPVLGEPAPSVLVGAGWNGHGVHLAVAGGALLADLALGRDTGAADLPWLRGRTRQVPGDPARALGLRAYLRALQAVDRLEALVDRTPSPSLEEPCRPVSR